MIYCWRSVLHELGFTDQRIGDMQNVSPGSISHWRRLRNLDSNGRKSRYKHKLFAIPARRYKIPVAEVIYHLALQISNEKTPAGAFKVIQDAVTHVGK